MKKLLDTLQALFPLLIHYPVWAQVLFVVTFLLMLVSIAIFVLLYPRVQKSMLDSQRTSKVRLAHFTLDETQSIYAMYRYDSHRARPPIEESHSSSGRITAYGRTFAGWAEFDSFCSQLDRETNHEWFEWLPRNVTIVVAKRRDARYKHVPPEFTYPLFTLSISNDSESQIILTRAELAVYEVIPVWAAGVSQPLESLVTYVLRIASRVGHYPLELVPPLKIAATDAATFSLRVLPLQPGHGKRDPTTKILIASIAAHANDYEVETPKFALEFED